jgi:hypothetical protein
VQLERPRAGDEHADESAGEIAIPGGGDGQRAAEHEHAAAIEVRHAQHAGDDFSREQRRF